MLTCPNCDAPLAPDAARCPNCVRDVRVSNVRLSRNPTWAWMARGFFVGMLFGAPVGMVYGIGLFTDPLLGGDRFVDFCVAPLAFTLFGGFMGAMVALAWKSLVRPVFLAIFASETFAREYGTPEEQGIVKTRREE